MSWFIKKTPFCWLLASVMLCITSQFAFSQTNYTKQDSTRIYYFLDKADEMSDVNLDSAMHYAKSAYTLSRQKKMRRGEGWALLKIGDLKKHTSKHDSIASYHLNGLKIADELKDDFMQGLAHFQLAQLYMFRNRYPESETHYKKSLAVKFEKDQDAYTAMVYSDLGFLFGLKGVYEKQIEWLLRAKRLADKLQDPITSATTLSNLATAYNNLGNKAEAFKMLRGSIEIRKKVGDKIGLCNNYNSLARLLQKDSLNAAIRYQNLAIDFAKQTGINGLIATSNSTMAMLLSQQGKNAEALVFEQKSIEVFREIGDKYQEAVRNISAAIIAGKLGNDKIALQHFKNAHDLATDLKNKTTLRDVFLNQSNYYRGIKDHSKAYENYKIYIAYKDSLIQEKTQGNIADLQLKYETEKKDNEITLLNNERIARQLEIERLENQKLIRNAIIAGIFGLLILAGVLFNRYQLKRQIEQQQMLINFRNDVARDLHDDIGSTLTSIKILSEVSRNNLVKDQAKAGSYLAKITEQSEHMQQEMSDIVWAIKPDNDKLAHMLARMREFVSHTLEPRNIRTTFVAEEQVLSSNLSMQQRRDFFLIFKEAVNNAAKYSNAKNVHISLQTVDKQIIMSIADDGIGFNQTIVSTSNGLKNMKSRADALLGTLSIQSVIGQGTNVILQIPVI